MKYSTSAFQCAHPALEGLGIDSTEQSCPSQGEKARKSAATDHPSTGGIAGVYDSKEEQQYNAELEMERGKPRGYDCLRNDGFPEWLNRKEYHSCQHLRREKNRFQAKQPVFAWFESWRFNGTFRGYVEKCQTALHALTPEHHGAHAPSMES